ncbi:MAG: TIGR02710 family CRISPR-associated protein [Gammaproteobacteria bacterium]|nr:MAG: TIGR02710 family CRISPR-associated protein [Gammaproteobacteria bacterium]
MPDDQPSAEPSRPRMALLQTVGTGGDKNPVWEALAKVTREREPDLLYQLCSQITKEKTIPKFDSELSPEELQRFERRIDTCPPEQEYQVGSLTTRYQKLIDQLRQEFPDIKIEADFTSGTKAMSAALFAAGISRQIDQLHYTTGPTDQTGRATRSDKVITLVPVVLTTERRLEILARLFNVGQFQAVCLETQELIKSLKSHADPSSDVRLLLYQAQTLRKIAEAYQKWDLFNWEGASHDLSKVMADESHDNRYSKAQWDLTRLKDQLSHLQQCKNCDPIHQMVDLYQNARRCISRHAYDDAVARFYRLCEYLLQWRFADQTGQKFPDETNIPTSQVRLDTLKERCPKLYQDKKRIVRGSTCKLGLQDTLRALAEMHDPIAKHIHDRYGSPWVDNNQSGPLANLLKHRNDSWLAHGFTPIDEDKAKGFEGTFEQLFLEIKADPCLREKINRAFDVTAFMKCPWGAR